MLHSTPIFYKLMRPVSMLDCMYRVMLCSQLLLWKNLQSFFICKAIWKYKSNWQLFYENHKHVWEWDTTLKTKPTWCEHIRGMIITPKMKINSKKPPFQFKNRCDCGNPSELNSFYNIQYVLVQNMWTMVYYT